MTRFLVRPYWVRRYAALSLLIACVWALMMPNTVHADPAGPSFISENFVSSNFLTQNTYTRVLCVSNSGSCPAQITTTVPCFTATCAHPSQLYSITAIYTTIQAAANASLPGDLIIIMPGTYRGVVIEESGGADNAYIHFRGWGAPGSVIVNDDQNDADGWLRDNFYFVDAHHYIIQNIAIHSAERSGIFFTGFFSATGHWSHHFIVADVFSHDNGTWGLHTTSTSYVLIQDSTFTDSGAEHGAYISGSGDHMLIRRNVFQGNNASGLQVNADPLTASYELWYWLDSQAPNTCGISYDDLGEADGQGTWAQVKACYDSHGLPNLGENIEDGISADLIIEQNVITGNGNIGGAGINLASVRASMVRNNLVYGNNAASLACWDDGYVDTKGLATSPFGCQSVQILNNTFIDPSGNRGALILTNDALNMTVYNNVIARPRFDAYDIDNRSAQGLRSGSNYYYDQTVSANSTGWITLDTDGGSGSITGFNMTQAQAQFVKAGYGTWVNDEAAWPSLNPNRPDYRVLSVSGLLTAGNASYQPSFDLEGRKRGTNEIGAYTRAFFDVAVGGKAWMEPWIAAFHRARITDGCGVDGSGHLLYCPEQEVTRAEMAVFIIRAMKYPNLPYQPNNPNDSFSDVPVATKEWMQPWIEEFYDMGITTGCGQAPLMYCPEDSVTRAEMAVFVVRALHYPSLPYTPTNPNDSFSDVPVATKEWMQPWIEEFYALGITTGCAVNPLRFCPEQPVTRAEMAVFILRAFSSIPHP